MAKLTKDPFEAISQLSKEQRDAIYKAIKKRSKEIVEEALEQDDRD